MGARRAFATDGQTSRTLGPRDDNPLRFPPVAECLKPDVHELMMAGLKAKAPWVPFNFGWRRGYWQSCG